MCCAGQRSAWLPVSCLRVAQVAFDSTSAITVSFWFAKFCSGDFSLENEPRERHQLKVNNDKLKAIIESGISNYSWVGIKLLCFYPNHIGSFALIQQSKIAWKMDSARIKRTSDEKTFICIRWKKESLFCIVSLLVMKNGSSMIIVSVQQAG